MRVFTQGRGEGRELNQREGERGNRGEYRSQSWVDNTNMTECTQETGYLQSINSDKQSPQQSLYRSIFVDDNTFALTSMSLISFYGRMLSS
jgi:hypothetical protein